MRLMNTPNTNTPRSPASGASQAQDVQLWHTTAKHLEATLTRTLGGRVSRLADVGPDVSAYRLAVSGNRRLQYQACRRTPSEASKKQSSTAMPVSEPIAAVSQ